ncbi:hypothetical protein LXM94_25010 [Rhizobium sp. TRM95111]|uniref:hypothetical protein n=1 Tax=Rhizobium alarense TaxID=2846851 RepID=UPI001F31ACD6|nr:hypothetical protein [Rhizobium alarense]MCF3643222.1 hypothetical protein [Rhizobium alarense]
MKKTKKTTAALTALASEFPALINRLDKEIDGIVGRMDLLKKGGLIYASPHWRKDSSGAEKYFYLLYPQQAGEKRRREYVGCDLEKIEEARAAIERGKEFDELNKQLSALKSRIEQVHEAMGNAKRYLTGSWW